MRAHYGLYRLGRGLICRKPWWLSFALAERVADCRWGFSREDREIVAQNLRFASGHDVSCLSHPVREVFRNFGRYLVEFFGVGQVSDLKFSVHGKEHLAQAQVGGRGAILLSAHLGNWELAAMFVHRLGFPIGAVALPHADPRVDALFNQQRERCGVKVIPLGVRAAESCVEMLRSGMMVGLVGDYAFGASEVSVSLFGRTVRLPRGPALLSMRTGVPLVPIFLVREGIWSFRLCVEKPIWPAAHRDRQLGEHSLMQEYGEVLGRFIRQWPSQWALFRPFETDARESRVLRDCDFSRGQGVKDTRYMKAK